MIIRKLTDSDSEALFSLIEDIESTLVSRDFWLPIKDTSKEHYFDPSWTEFYGAFDGDRLVGASALFYNPFEFGESVGQINESPTVWRRWEGPWCIPITEDGISLPPSTRNLSPLPRGGD